MYDTHRKKSRFDVRFAAEDMYIDQVRSLSPEVVKETIGDFQLGIMQS